MSDIIKLLETTGAIRKGHFVLSSGRHSDTYIEKHDVLASPKWTEQLTQEIARRVQDFFESQGVSISTVAGVATCGITLSQRVAFHLSNMNGKEIAGIFADRDSNKQLSFRRGGWDERHVKGKNILIVDDMITSGDSQKRMINLVRSTGGNIVASAVMISRNPQVTTELLGVPLIALASIDVPSYDEADPCPLCKAGVPVDERPGYGREYLQKKAAAKPHT